MDLVDDLELSEEELADGLDLSEPDLPDDLGLSWPDAAGELDDARWSAGPYLTSSEHLSDELRRIDLLVRAQTVRWRMTIGAGKPEHLWGMVNVTDDEVSAYLASPFVSPDSIPGDLEEVLVDYWRAARRAALDIDRRRAQTSFEVTLRLDRLQCLLGLSDLERDILLVCLLPELDGRYRRLYGYLQDDASRVLPTVELVLQILAPEIPEPSTGREVFEARSALLKHSLIVPNAEPRRDEPLSTRAVRVDDRVAGYLLGSDQIDDRLGQVLCLWAGQQAWTDLVMGEETIACLQRLADWWSDQGGNAVEGAVLLLHGPYGSGRLKAAQAMSAACGIPLLVANVATGLRAGLGWEEVVDLCCREAALQGAALYWRGCELLLSREQPACHWDTLVAAAEHFAGLVFLECQASWDPAERFHDRTFLRLEFPAPAYGLRIRFWEQHLPPAAAFLDPTTDRGALAGDLANDFQFTQGQILDALAIARGEAALRSPLHARYTREDFYEGCRRQSGRQLVTFARRIEPRSELTFDDLVLPAPNKRQLLELSERIRLRSQVYVGLGFERRLSLGKGLVALFTGTSGTGKTMAAELLARERGVDLYKVDLSAITSKWVGETEKNLSRLFAEAEEANAMLLFDEADALFGKRGEVKEAQDRWANMEVNYLLQRLEEYHGVVILASNLRQNIDEAFMRRIQWIVDFPFPDARARREIYAGMFIKTRVECPAEAGLRIMADRFSLTGGSIKNIVVDATFRAMAAGSLNEQGSPIITLRHLALSAAREYQKLGKPITRGEFGDDFYPWIEAEILM